MREEHPLERVCVKWIRGREMEMTFKQRGIKNVKNVISWATVMRSSHHRLREEDE